jgi:hypothetical protein
MQLSEKQNLDEVQRLVDDLPREDRASLRPWLLAHFDDDGNPQRGYQPPPGPMSIVAFHTFVDALDTALRSCLRAPHEIALAEEVASATWTRGPFRAGVERRDLSARAWVGFEGHVAREFFEPLTTESAQQLGAEFAALLSDFDTDE